MIVMRIVGPIGKRSFNKLPDDIKNNMFIGMQKAIDLIIATATTKYLSGPYPHRIEATDTRLRLKAGLWGKAELSARPGELARATIADSEQHSTTHEGPDWARAWWGREFVIEAKKKPRLAKAKDGRMRLKGGMSFFWKRRGIKIWHARYVRVIQRPFLKPAILDNIEVIKSTLDVLIRKAVGSP